MVNHLIAIPTSSSLSDLNQHPHTLLLSPSFCKSIACRLCRPGAARHPVKPVHGPASKTTSVLPAPHNPTPPNQLRNPYDSKICRTTHCMTVSDPQVTRSKRQYTFLQNPLGVAAAIVPYGWTWASHKQELQQMIDNRLAALKLSMPDRSVMFGASQLKTWLLRSCTQPTYQANADDEQSTYFPFTIQRCLIIWGFEHAHDQTSAEAYCDESYDLSVKGDDANRHTSSGQGSCDNPLGVYAVVCAKHITQSNFVQEKKQCKTRLKTYAASCQTRIYRPRDVWKDHYAQPLNEMFNKSDKHPASYSATWQTKNFGTLKKCYTDIRRKLSHDATLEFPTAYESQEY